MPKRWGTERDGSFWDLSFRRDFQDCEVTELQVLLALLHKQCEPVDRPYASSWELVNNKVCSTKFFHEKLPVRAEDNFSYESV